MNVCMPAYTFYEQDTRVRRYAEALAERGDTVEVIALRRPGQERTGRLRGVRIFRVQQRIINERGKWSYLGRVFKFLLRSALFMSARHLSRPYDLIHVHSVPDFEVFAAVLPKLTGARIILDIHDIVPEFYAGKFGVGRDALAFKGLLLLEKLAVGFSDWVIISNDLWQRKLIARAGCRHKCESLINYPDDSIFYPRPTTEKSDQFVILYPGSLNRHQGLDIAIRAMARVVKARPNARLDIYGEGPARPELEALISELGLAAWVLLHPPLASEAIAAVMAQADLGVVPKRNDPFGGDAFSTKVLEFMSLGVPLVIARTRIDQYYFDDRVVSFFEPDNPDDLATKLLQLIGDPQLRQCQAEAATALVRRLTWSTKKNRYLELVDRLVANRHD